MPQPPGAPAVGSQINGDYQYEFRGVKIGSGTPYVTTKLTGILDQPPIVQYHSKAVSKHGVFYGYEVFDARTIDIDVSAHSEGDEWFTGNRWAPEYMSPGAACERLVDMFADAFSIPGVFANALTVPLTSSQIDDPLVIKRPGKDARQIFCHVTKRALPTDGDIATGLAAIALEMYAGDPIVYSLVQHSATFTIPSGSTTTGDINLHNNGNFPSPRVTATFTGPGGTSDDSLWIIANNSAPGASTPTIRLNAFIGGTDVVALDLSAKTITLNGSNSYSMRRPDSGWWALQPGDNQIVFSRSTTDDVESNITFTWYDAWNSA